MPKYVVVLGSIMSGLGKGVLSASIGKILQSSGYSVAPLKFDGYLNVDCGTMNPFRHGEVFVLRDGSEVDVDFGTYERFLNIDLKGGASLTGGKIFSSIINKERKGEYLGRDVQFIPHVTDFIKSHIKNYAEGKDFCLIEVGGTVGDIENSYFIEALRQLSHEEDVLFIQLTYLPNLYGELKTKPTQQANKLLLRMGIVPKIIIARTSKRMDGEVRKKIALYCNVDERDVFNDLEVDNVYELPLLLISEGLHESLSRHLKTGVVPRLDSWRNRVMKLKKGELVNVCIVGKYVSQVDSYASLREAIVHAGVDVGVKPYIKFIDSEKFGEKDLNGIDALVVAGGFGRRGIEGKLRSIQLARERELPLLGICLGMQLMVIEYAKNILGLDACSEEFGDCGHNVVSLQENQRGVKQYGGTLRLGDYVMKIKEGTLLNNIYGKNEVSERHRHRYEINPKYVEMLEKHGLIFSAEHNGLVEAVEYSNGMGVGLQCHPEFNSRFERPSPVFRWLLERAKHSRASAQA